MKALMQVNAQQSNYINFLRSIKFPKVIKKIVFLNYKSTGYPKGICEMFMIITNSYKKQENDNVFNTL